MAEPKRDVYTYSIFQLQMPRKWISAYSIDHLTNLKNKLSITYDFP